MPTFLSEEWIAELAVAVQEVSGPFEVTDTVVEQRITRGDLPDVAYQVVIDTDGVRLLYPPSEKPDLVFSQDVATARALALGVLAPRVALADGRLAVSGEPARLLELLEPLSFVAAATAGLRNQTAFDDS